MCGIAGFLVLRDSARGARADALQRVREQMRARGPDGAGLWVSADGRVGLAHRRLAIIDLAASGAQPMHEGKRAVSFNGEIYNYRRLRTELEASGEHFTSSSDTEVLLKLHRQDARGMFARLRGMYGFALWDDEAEELTLARDPLGIKPLYLAEVDGVLWFASQARALVDSGVVPAAPDLRAWNQFLLWGSIPEPRTAYAAVQALEAGTFLRIRPGQGRGTVERHFDLAAAWASAGGRADQAEVREAVADSVRHHLVADVPVGVFLSAGIDSGAVLGLACEAGDPPATLTLGFAEFEGQARDEAPLAAEVARHYGAPHHLRRVDRQEFEQDLPRILAAMDQPSIDGINTWFVAKAARELGWKVALSGLGGDELFGGYPSFRDLPLWRRWLGWTRHVPGMGERVGRLVGRLASHPKAQGLLRFGASWSGAYFLRRGLFMPWELDAECPSWLPRDPAALDESLRQLDAMLTPDPGSDHARVGLLETGAYMRNQLLRDADWASMAHSVELRVPLVDAELLRRLAPRMPAAVDGPAKAALAQAPARPLPAALIERPKTGFETPVAGWMQGARRKPGEPWARGWARQLLCDGSWLPSGQRDAA